ncbi:MAG: VOC family protein [Steroidobacteraceae bacterium]
MYKFNQIGLCVADADAAERFFVQGLGFERRMTAFIGEAYGKLLALGPNMSVEVHILSKDGFTLELLHMKSPRPTSAGATAMNTLGFTHMSLIVEDLDVGIERLCAHGGTVLAHTRLRDEHGEYVFCTGPAGIRVELAHFFGSKS